jgi:NADPH:quinone reductase-like Zn-dependent oxidoreductase
MKAVRLLEYGGPLVFNDVPTPTIPRDEVLVKINSTAVNHIDLVKAWKDIALNLPGVHGMLPSGPGAARRRSHGKIVLRVA